jgi:hypothetical protein
LDTIYHLPIPKEVNDIISHWVKVLKGVRSTIRIEPIIPDYIQRDFHKAIFDYNGLLKGNIVTLGYPDSDGSLNVIWWHFHPEFRATPDDGFADYLIILATVCH